MRTRIITVITIVTALGLLATGLTVYFVERHRILDQVDTRLRANLESAQYIVSEGSPETGTWESSTAALTAVVERMSPDDNTGAFGMTSGRITTVPGVRLDLDLQHERAFAQHVDRVTQQRGATIGIYAENGVSWQYLAAPIAITGSAAPQEVTFVMVYDLEAELAEFDGAARAFILVSLITLLLVAATGTVVATRLLRPLRQMRETADQVTARTLDARLPIVGNDDVAELAETMNQMLDRLDGTLDSQRQLLSDVGHELKTPITIVRGHLEVMDAEDAADARATRDLAVDELERMGRLVQDLAASAALHGPSPVQPEPVDLADLMQQIARKANGLAGAHVQLGPVSDGVATLDPARITQAMLQLAQNAVTHGGGQIEMGTRTEGTSLQLWVRDHGPGVPESERAMIFERFSRAPSSAHHQGSGLGLHIVQVIARAHSGEVFVADAVGGGACFVISLPGTGLTGGD